MGAIKYDRTLFEPEHDLFRESYRGFLERHVAPFHDEWEKNKIVDRQVWLEAGKQGFLGMAVPEEYGGGGGDDFALRGSHRRSSRKLPPAATAPSFGGSPCTATIIAHYVNAPDGSEEQKQRTGCPKILPPANWWPRSR